jgi:hypothetical protein
MRLVGSIALACLLVGLPALAQVPANPQPASLIDSLEVSELTSLFEVGATEWMVTAGPAFGVQVFHSAGGHRYALQTISWARVLTEPRGSSFWRGRFEWAVEAVPVFGQFAPTRTFGVGLTPLAWRWNFEPRARYAPYAELAGGALFTSDPVPVRTTHANFTAHIGVGVRRFVRPQQAVVLGYRFHHISNGNRLERNPGVNAHVVVVGWSYMPRRPSA